MTTLLIVLSIAKIIENDRLRKEELRMIRLRQFMADNNMFMG